MKGVEFGIVDQLDLAGETRQLAEEALPQAPAKIQYLLLAQGLIGFEIENVLDAVQPDLVTGAGPLFMRLVKGGPGKQVQDVENGRQRTDAFDQSQTFVDGPVRFAGAP